MKNTTVVESYSKEMVVSDVGTINPSFKILENHSTSGELKYLFPWRGKKVRVTLELLEDVVDETPVENELVSPPHKETKDEIFKYQVDMWEYERGWGVRVDYSLYFASKDSALEYIDWYNDRYNSDKYVPDWYMSPEYVGEVK